MEFLADVKLLLTRKLKGQFAKGREEETIYGPSLGESKLNEIAHRSFFASMRTSLCWGSSELRTE